MKDCLIIGPGTVMGYNGIYELLRDKVLKIGLHRIVTWENCDGNYGYWFSTLQVNRPDNKKLKPINTYDQVYYQTYDNFQAIESKSKDIPVDYDGLIGVPISFLKYYPDLDYEIVEKRSDLVLNGKQLFARLIIRRKQL